MSYVMKNPDDPSMEGVRTGYFSNPNVYSETGGALAADPTGTLEHIGEGGPADNAASLSYTAPIIAEYYPQIDVFPVTITALEDEFFYDGLPKSPVLETYPPDLPFQITWIDALGAPTEIGSWDYVAEVDYLKYEGSLSGTVEIRPIEATIVLSGLVNDFDMMAKEPVITTEPPGLDYELAWEHGEEPPIEVGSWPFTVTITEPKYVGSVQESLRIKGEAVEIEVLEDEFVYDGTAREPNFTFSPPEVDIAIEWEGRHSAPTDAGSYPYTLRVTDRGYEGSHSGVMVILKAPAEITMVEDTKVFAGMELTPDVVTSPSDLSVTFEWGGGGATPAGAGSYGFVANIDEPNYQGSLLGVFTIAPAPVSFELSYLEQVFTGNALVPVVYNDPPDVAYQVLWDSGQAPIYPGEWGFKVKSADSNYEGSRSGTLTITPAQVSIQAFNTTVIYNGEVQPPTLSLSPPFVSYELSWSEAGEPKDVGDYEFLVEVTQPGYEGSLSGSVRVDPAPAYVFFGVVSKPWDGLPFDVEYVTQPSGLNVELDWGAEGEAPSAVGTYTVSATIDEPNYEGSSGAQVTIVKREAEVQLSELTTIYNTAPQGVSVQTDPSGLDYIVTYDGDEALPVDVGQYYVSVEILDDSHFGSASALMNIEKAEATITIVDAEAVYTGDELVPGYELSVPGLEVVAGVLGGGSYAIDAGTYLMELEIDDANYHGRVETEFTIHKAVATIVVDRGETVYEGVFQYPNLSTDPVNLHFELEFVGLDGYPTDAGAWPYTAQINDANYAGLLEADFIIHPKEIVGAFHGLDQQYDGTPRVVEILNTPQDADMQVTYDGASEPPVDAGQYLVRAFSGNPNYAADDEMTLTVHPMDIDILFGALVFPFDGEPKPVTVTTDPPGVGVTLSYDGQPQPPTQPGRYAVVATAEGPNHQGSKTATLVIEQSPLSLSLHDLEQTYTGLPLQVRVEGADGNPVTVLYDGAPYPPTDAGTYDVTAEVDTPNLQATASATFVILPMPVTASLVHAEHIYDGQPPNPVVTTEPPGLPYSAYWLPSGQAPRNAGSYTLRVTIDSPNHVGTTDAAYEIIPAEVEWEITGLEQEYSGSALRITAQPSVPGVGAHIIYDGSPNRPTNAGVYEVEVRPASINYRGTELVTMVISPRPVTFELSGLTRNWSGEPVSVSVFPSRPNVDYIVTYNGSTEPPRNAGYYDVVVQVDDPNYTGSPTDTLHIKGVLADISLSGLAQVYDGSPREVSVEAEFDDLPIEVTYDGSAEAPVDAGSYHVVARYVHDNIEGLAEGTLVVAPQPVELSFVGDLDVQYSGEPVSVEVATDPAGVPVQITYDGSGEPPADVGVYELRAAVSSPNHSGSLESTLTIRGIEVAVSLSSLEHVYDGTPMAAVVSADIEGLEFDVLYDGDVDIPTNVGVYQVSAAVATPGYTGSASAQLTITPAQAAVELIGLERVYDGQPAVVVAVTQPEDLALHLTYDGGDFAPEDAGVYSVEAQVTDPNWGGSASGQLVIAQAQASLSLGMLEQLADGAPKPVEVSTDPAGLSYELRYDGELDPPVSAGSYQVSATLIEHNYYGQASAELVLSCDAQLCEVGQLSCDDEGRDVMSCELSPWGCPALSVEQACGVLERCDDAECVLLCEDECAEGALTCERDQPATCALGASGCLEWQLEPACGGGSVCHEGRCEEQLSCDDACDVGEATCEDGVPHLCVAGGDQSCPSLEPQEACADGYTCDAGACALSCDSCQEGDLQCSSDARSVQRCEEVETGCTRWVTERLCDSGDACSDSRCGLDGPAGPGDDDVGDYDERDTVDADDIGFDSGDMDGPSRPPKKGGCQAAPGSKPSGGLSLALLALALVIRRRRAA